MTPFGFSPDGSSSDDENSGKPEDFSAMLEEIQKQMAEQFQKLGINPVGFVNPFAATQESLPKNIVRDTAKRIVATHGSLPIGNVDTSVVSQASSIAQLWLNEATVFPPITTATKTLSRNDWVDETLASWQITVEPLAQGLTNAVQGLIADANNGEARKSF